MSCFAIRVLLLTFVPHGKIDMRRSARVISERVNSMTSAKQKADDVTPENWNWETVQEESATRIIFDTIGDEFIGQYKGSEHIAPEKEGSEEFDLFRFIGFDGNPYAVNHSYSLVTAMKKVEIDEWVRITYTKDLATKRSRDDESGDVSPMKDFRVDVRRK